MLEDAFRVSALVFFLCVCFFSSKASNSLFCASSGKTWDYHSRNITQILGGYEILTGDLPILVLLKKRWEFLFWRWENWNKSGFVCWSSFSKARDSSFNLFENKLILCLLSCIPHYFEKSATKPSKEHVFYPTPNS